MKLLIEKERWRGENVLSVMKMLSNKKSEKEIRKYLEGKGISGSDADYIIDSAKGDITKKRDIKEFVIKSRAIQSSIDEFNNTVKKYEMLRFEKTSDLKKLMKKISDIEMLLIMASRDPGSMLK